MGMSMEALWNSPMGKMMTENPEWMLEMMQQGNPKMKAMLERNPHIKHALQDPNTIKELIRAQQDPLAYQEAMRGHDRALANIENLPGGFQALQNFYTKELADVEESVHALSLAGDSENTDQREFSNPRYGEQLGVRTTEPMPNPWKQPQHQRPHASLSPLPLATTSSHRPLVNSSPSFATSPPPPTPPPRRRPRLSEVEAEEQFTSQLQLMEQMGFLNRKANIQALMSTDGNLNAAIESVLLLDSGGAGGSGSNSHKSEDGPSSPSPSSHNERNT
jgi:hypothetical protein